MSVNLYKINLAILLIDVPSTQCEGTICAFGLRTRVITESQDTDLWFNQDQVDEQDHEVVFNIFVGKPLAMRTLGEADAFAQRTVIGFAVGGVEVSDWSRACDAYWHAVVASEQQARLCACRSCGRESAGGESEQRRGCQAGGGPGGQIQNDTSGLCVPRPAMKGSKLSQTRF